MLPFQAWRTKNIQECSASDCNHYCRWLMNACCSIQATFIIIHGSVCVCVCLHDKLCHLFWPVSGPYHASSQMDNSKSIWRALYKFEKLFPLASFVACSSDEASRLGSRPKCKIIEHARTPSLEIGSNDNIFLWYFLEEIPIGFHQKTSNRACLLLTNNCVWFDQLNFLNLTKTIPCILSALAYANH